MPFRKPTRRHASATTGSIGILEITSATSTVGSFTTVSLPTGLMAAPVLPTSTGTLQQKAVLSIAPSTFILKDRY